MKTLRQHRKLLGWFMTCLMALWLPGGSYADTLYMQNTGTDTTLNTATFTPTAPGAILQSYAEGTAFTAGDSINFSGAITGTATYRISTTTGTNLSVSGLSIGSLFNGALLNPAGTVTIRNGAGASGSPVANTLTLGAGGIDLSLSTRDLTLSQDVANGSSLTVTTSANQTWLNRTGRTISLAAAPLNLAHNITLVGAGTTTFGGSGTGSISGAGNLIIHGTQFSGTTVVNLSGTNAGWTGAVTVGNAASHLRLGGTLNLDQTGAGQNKLADAQTLTINNARVNLQGTGTGTEIVAGVALGRGLNGVTRSAGTGILQMNGITRVQGAAVDFGNIATSGASHVTTDVLNTAAGQIGAWAVGINSTTDANWIKTAGAGTDIAALALSGADYTTQNNMTLWAANQNIIVTGATTAAAASTTIGSLKMNTAAVASMDIGAGNTLTIDDGINGGGIIGVGNFTRVIGHATTIGQGSLTAGVASDANADTLYLYNTQNTTTINMVIADNGTDALHLFSGGAGSVTLNAVNTFTGGITVAAGVLRLGANSATTDAATLGTGDILNHGNIVIDKSTAASDAQMTFANNITGTGQFTINRDTAILSGVNDYTGSTNVGASTTLRAGSATGISANSRMLLNAATAVLDLNGFDVSVAAMRGDQTTANVALGGNTLTLSGSVLANSSSAETLDFVPQIYQGGFTGAGNLIKNGLFTQTLTAGGTVAYTGTTTVNAGILQTNKAMSTSALTVNNSTPTLLGGGSAFISNIANSLTTTTAVNLANAGSIWQINNGFNQSIGSLAGATDSRVFLQGGAGSIVLTITDNGGVPTVFNGVINAVTGAGIGSVVKAGTNTWVLGGGNSFDGGLTINGGVVQVAAATPVGVLGDLVPVTLADVAGAALDINGNAGSVGSLAGGGATGGNVTLGSAGSLAIGYNNTSTSFGGIISGGTAGVNNLVKIGTGTQTLTGANTFAGNVLIGNFGGQSGGGLTLGTGGALSGTTAVRNAGFNTVFTVNSSDAIGALTGSVNTALALGAGAALTSTYTDGTAVVGSATMDSDTTAGRVVRLDGSIVNPQVGMLVTGTGLKANTYIVQILDANHVLLNDTANSTTANFAPTATTVGVLHSAMTGAGGFTKDGTGTLILTGNSSITGATTINNGTVQLGGVWTGQKYSIHDILGDSSQIVFSATNATTLRFARSATDLLAFERVGSLSGGMGGASTSIFLESGTSNAVLAVGGDNSTSTFAGQIMGGGGSATMLIKEGTGNFTWNNTVVNIFDGPVYIQGGTLTVGGTEGLDGSNEVYMSNAGTTFVVNEAGGETIPFLHGGAGSSRNFGMATLNSTMGTNGNFLTSGPTVLNLATNLTVQDTNTSNNYTFNGDIQGAGTLIKSGAHQFNLTGISSNTHTGETQVTAGTLRMGILGAATGVGAPGSGQNGTLSTATGLRLTGGTLDINGTTQTVSRFNASSTGGTIQLVNGTLTLANQNSQTVGTAFTGNRNAVLNINASAASTLTLTNGGASFAGSVNVGTNAALTISTGTNFGDLARINLNGTGTQLTMSIFDNIGSIAGTGDIVLTAGIGLLQAESGVVSATGFSGATSGAGALLLNFYGGLTVSGNMAHTGGITLGRGALLNLAYGAGNNILPGTGALTLNGGRVQVLSTASTVTILESAASTNLNAGASSIETWTNHTPDNATWQGMGKGGVGLGAITRATGGTINFGENAASTTTANTAGILGGYATFAEGTWAVANGAGTAISGLALAGYTADGVGAGVHNDVTAGTGTGTAETLRFNGAAAANQTGAITVNTGGILVTKRVGANTSTISGALDATGNELIIHQYNPLGDLVLSNVGGASTAITTAGGGKTIITNDIAGTGVTNIGYGYLQLGSGGSTGMVGGGTIFNNGTLGINRSNAQTISAIISGGGNLEQLGSGTTTLSGVNTYLGRTTVRAGTLEITDNAGLGGTNFGYLDRWANLTSVNTGGALLLNVAAGGTITELLNLDGGTLDLRSTVATTLNAPIVLSGDSTIHVSNPGAAVNHLITGEIYALPGADLTVTNVGGATPSTLVLTPSASTGARWENTTINAGGRLQIGGTGAVGSRGFLGTGAVTNNGTLIINPNDAYYVISNNITGSGTLDFSRGTNGLTYLTGDLSGFTGTLRVGSLLTNTNSDVELGNDTYGASYGSGAINIVANSLAGGGGRAQVRTHFNQDVTLGNNITLTPGSDGTNPKNAQFTRAGLGNVTLNGNLTIGATNTPAPGTQRAILQTEAGGKLYLNATLVGGGANNLLNIVNNNSIIIGGTASQSYHGILSSGSTSIIYAFDNTGTTTLLGVNTFNTAYSMLRKGTLVIGTGGVDTIHNDNDMHVLRGATLSVVGNETIGQLYMQGGAVTTIASGATLTVDDAGTQLVAGSIQGAGNLTLAGGNYMAMYGTNTATGALSVANGNLQLKNFANAIGSFSSVTLGGGTTGGRIDYVGSGETYAGNFTLAGTGSTLTAAGTNRISATGNGALVLSGNLTASASNTLQLTGQTGGYFNPITNTISGAITEGANTLTLAVNPKVNDDDRYGITGRWALTNAGNDFHGNITVNIGMLEFGGDLGTGGAVGTSQLGDLTVARTIDLGTNDYNGRRYDTYGSTDQISNSSVTNVQGTNTLAPNSGNSGTIIFNSTNAATFTLPSLITLTQSWSGGTNPGAGQIINDGLGAVVIQGNLTAGATVAHNWYLDGTNTGTNTVSGIISNGGGLTSLIKEGAGTWRLSGANTFTGTTTIQNGILELAGGAAIADGNTIAINADSADGLYSGTAKLRVLNSETIGLLSGDVLTEAEIAAGQTLTISAAGTNTMNGLITGGGNLTRTTAGAAAAMNPTAKNTYGGITTLSATGTATGSTTFTIWQLADGGLASGLGQSSNAAGNLVFGSNTAGTFGGILAWAGLTNQSTDRLFTLGLGAAGARINASGTVVGVNAPTMTWSNTGALAFAGVGARTLTLGGTASSINVFRPAITDGGGATSLIKTDGGFWLLDPAAAANTYTGGTTITGGTLAIQAGNALGTGLITVNGSSGVGLELRGGITVANNLTTATTAEGGFGTFSGNNILSGTVTLSNTNARIPIAAGTSLELNNATAAWAGTGAWTKQGNGTLIMSGVNTSTGAMNVRNGILELNYATNNTSKIGDAAVLTLGGIAANNVAGLDANSGGQTLQHAGGGGTVHLNGGSHVEVVASTAVETGSNAVTRAGGSTAVLRMNAISRGNSLGTIDFGADGIADTDTLNTANGILGGGYATVGKTNWAVSAATGTDIAITALATYGLNTYGAASNVDVTTYAGIGTAANTLRFNNAAGGNFTHVGAFSMTGGGLLMTPNVTGDVVISGGFIQNAATTAGLEALIVHQHSTTNVLEINSIIQNNTPANAQAFTKTGAGKVILSGLNAYSGVLSLFEGELQVGGTAAAPATATNAFLGGLGQASNNNTSIVLAEDTILRFLTTNTTVYNTPVITGAGKIIMDTGNLGAIWFDDDNVNWSGDLDFFGGTIRVGSTNTGTLGGLRGLLNVANSVNFLFTSATSPSKVTNYAQGTIINIQNAATTFQGTFTGPQFFNNTTTGGLEFNVPAATSAQAGTMGLYITGLITGSNGFTKTGNGILGIGANNFADVRDGYTGINMTPTLSGQIAINGGVLYIGNARSLGAHGVGNEVVVAPGASLDLRDMDLNYGDDSDTTRKIVQISGTGFNGTGALRNTAGTAQLSHLTLNANATINSGGTGNASAMVIGTFDTHLSNANSLPGAFTRNSPVINGGGFALTIQGGRVGTDSIVIADPTFFTALGSLLIREGGFRFRHEVSANIGGASGVGITAANITGGIEIGYGDLTTGDLTGAVAGLGANVGARLLFENWYGTTHSVALTMNGALAAAAAGTPGGPRSLAGGFNYLSSDFFTIPDGTTYLTGGISLSGNAIRNNIVVDSIGNYSVQEQGNTLGATVTKLIINGAITGTGGFTKTGFAETRLTADNTFSGDLNVLRYGYVALPFQTSTTKIWGVDYANAGLGEGWAEWGLTLKGASGAVSDVGTITLQRRGMITLDNTTRTDATSGVVGGNNNNRIADDAITNMNNGWLRLQGGTVDNTEALGTVNVQSGTNILDFYPTDGAGTDMDLTIGTLTRTAGGVLRIVNLDATATFSGSIAAAESVRVGVTTLGATQIGGGGAANTANMSIVQGVFGGSAPIGLDTDFRLLGFNGGNNSDLWNQQRNIQYFSGSHFMTYEGGFLRPLDDDEYFTPADGLLSSLTPANRNVNLSDTFTIVKENASINALRLGALQDHDGSGGTLNATTNLMQLVDHQSINLLVDGTLKIESGMLSSAYFTIGNTSSVDTFIYGGALDMNAREAIINVQNALYRTTDGLIAGGTLYLRSALTNATGLTKTGWQSLVLGGANTYTGLTTINEGAIYADHGRSALGAGGAGNGVVITGMGHLYSNGGVVIGTPTAREDIYMGVGATDNYALRTFADVTLLNGNITIDNVDIAGQPLFTPRIRTDGSAIIVLNGNIAGADTPISNDVLAIDSRAVQFDSVGNNLFIVRGQIGDRFDGSGNAIPIADPISTLPTLAGTRTNENEVLRVTLAGGSDETSLVLDRQYNAAGRLTLSRGTIIANYNPVGGDGTGFWTNTALSRIPGADSTTTSFAVNGGTGHQGFIMGSTSNAYGALFLSRPGQIFNMASWSTSGSGAKHIGGLNESGTVTFGTGNGTLTLSGVTANFYAADGGTVVFNSRIAGNTGTAPSSFGFVKQGRGTVEIVTTVNATASDSNFILAGGTLVLNHQGINQVRTGNQNVRFDGGTLVALANAGANSAISLAADNAAARVLDFSIGGNEIVARTTNTGTARNMTINLGNANANANTSNFTRSLGATANFVEDKTAGGTASITLQFNSFTTAAVKNQIIAWATYGTLSRTATDFAMADAGAANDVMAYSRALDEYKNDVTTWGAGQDLSENGGAGFFGTLGGALSISTLRFDANADSTINLGTNILTVTGNGLASSGGGILVSSNVGAANKTITGSGAAALTTTGGRSELIIHHYGTGNLNLNVPITGANTLVITGPSTTNAATIGTTGAVVLNGVNTYTGRTILNGSVLSIDSAGRLGANPGAYTADQLIFNGGTLRYTGSGLSQTASNYGITFQGNGGTIDVVDGAGEFRLSNDFSSVAQHRGDLIKVGAGTLTLAGGLLGGSNTDNPNFSGLIDVRQGTLRLNGTSTGAAGTSTILGTNYSYVDGTIFRSGANLAIQMGNGNDTGDWTIEEWLTFEGNNYVSVGTINTQTGNVSATPGFNDPNNERAIHLTGLITINGTTTFDVVSGQTLRVNSNSVMMTTGSGTIIKDGNGSMQMWTNNVDYTGSIVIKQGQFLVVGAQAEGLGTGYLGGATVTLGANDRQNLANLYMYSDSTPGHTLELNHNLNVVYNPAQMKRLSFENLAAASDFEVNGSITLNDSLQVYINDGADTGGTQNYVNFNGQLLDGATTSGNLVLHGDDTGGANDNTNGRTYNYLVLKNNNSGWTGDVRVSLNTGYDQDQTAILRLEHAQALTAANDVDMGYNSMLQVGGGARTIGSLSTNGGVGPFLGGSAGGTMGASSNGTSVVIENAASTAGTLTITQTTPASTEVQWNAHFRDGQMNSEFFAPGAGPTPAAALNIVKAGGGWATLATDNDYTGTTLVTGGILQVGRGGVGDTGNATTNGGLTANAGTTIAGTGQIHGVSIILGNLRPGDEAGGSMGTLVFTAATTFGDTSNITLQAQRASYTITGAVGYDDATNYGAWLTGIPSDTTYSHLLNDPVMTGQHDKIIVANASLLTTISGSKVVVSNNGYNPTAGDVFNLIDWTGASLGYNVGGTSFNGGLLRTGAETGTDLDLFDLGANFRWDVSLFDSQGIIVVVVPEPSRALLLLLGLLGLFARRRRRRSL